MIISFMGLKLRLFISLSKQGKNLIRLVHILIFEMSFLLKNSEENFFRVKSFLNSLKIFTIPLKPLKVQVIFFRKDIIFFFFYPKLKKLTYRILHHIWTCDLLATRGQYRVP